MLVTHFLVYLSSATSELSLTSNGEILKKEPCNTILGLARSIGGNNEILS